ncbi:MAG: PAS domain S-box protein, partial [Leeuwenhoekiella sp.]
MSICPTEIQFKEFLSNNTPVCQWLIEKHIDGIWYSSWDKPQDFWLNDDFHSLFDFSSGKLSKEDPLFRGYINSHSNIIIEKLITAAIANPRKKHQATIIFNEELKKEIRLLAEIKTVYEQGIVLKFKHLKAEKETTDSQLREELENLKKLTSVYNETNEIARIGGWDVDLVKNSIKWTNVTCDIHELSRDYIPDLETGISFYKEGWSRDLITKLFGEAVEKGQPFDDEFKLVTAKGNEIWVRSFGKPEFKDGKCIRVFGAFQDIDQQKKRQIELRDAKDRFESIFDNSPVGTLLFDLSDNIVAINPSSRNILGFENFSEDEISSLSFEDFIKPESLKTFGKHKSILQKGVNKKDKVEIACTHVSGRTIWCNMISSLMPGRKDEGKLVITKIQDITQQKELQRLASENANKFIKAFENSPNGMCVVSTDGSWVMINKNLSQMMGYKAQELRNLSLKNITHPDDLHKDIILKRKLLSKEIEHYKLDKRFIHKNGRIVICQLHVSAIYDGNGQVTSFINQMVDMTQNFKVQKELKRSLSDFQGLLDATTQIIIIETDRKHAIRKFNKGAERMLGYKAEEVLGKEPSKLFHLPHEIEARKAQFFENNNLYVQDNEIFTINLQKEDTEPQEWTYKRKDGSEFTVQLRITAVHNQEGKVTGYLGIATDISELKTMETSLIAAKEKAESASESKSE